MRGKAYLGPGRPAEPPQTPARVSLGRGVGKQPLPGFFLAPCWSRGGEGKGYGQTPTPGQHVEVERKEGGLNPCSHQQGTSSPCQVFPHLPLERSRQGHGHMLAPNWHTEAEGSKWDLHRLSHWQETRSPCQGFPCSPLEWGEGGSWPDADLGPGR